MEIKYLPFGTALQLEQRMWGEWRVQEKTAATQLWPRDKGPGPGLPCPAPAELGFLGLTQGPGGGGECPALAQAPPWLSLSTASVGLAEARAWMAAKPLHGRSLLPPPLPAHSAL